MPSKKMENIEPAERSEYSRCCREDNFGQKILLTLVGVLLVYTTFYIGTLMRNNIKKYNTIGEADKMERTITVNGFAKVSGRNDIAMTTIGYTNVDAEVAKAQLENKKVMDNVLAELKKLGIEEKDLQTDYSISPEYNYTQARGTELKGYRVTNNIIVKIRDLEKIPAILSIPSKHGANQVGSLSFTIDDTENLKSEARAKAIVEAKKKAMQMANLLGVRLGEIINYNDYEQGPVYPYYAKSSMAEGMGGVLMNGPSDVMGGSKDIGMYVNITYKLLK